MKKIKLEILGLTPSQSQSGSFTLVLGEEFGNRRLPIIIGVFEAQAIAVQIESIAPSRPMTHDLFKLFAKALNFTLTEVQINELREGVFYAKLHCHDGLNTVQIDSRPSDAIAIALRFDIPIYTNEEVMQEAGITSTEFGASGDEEDLDETTELVKGQPTGSFSDQIKGFTVEELQNILEEALRNEEYERAAKIRDELSKRN